MDAVGPEVDLLHLAQVALLDVAKLMVPLARQALDDRCAQARITAETLGQGWLEVPGCQTA